MLRPTLSCFLLVSTLLLGSCTKDDSPVPAPLYLLDQRWILTDVNGQATSTASETDLLLPSSTARNSGRAACNQYGGAYELTAGSPQLRFSNQASTKATCPELAQETTYLALLPQVARYTISGRTLQLYDATHGQPVLTFRAAE
ncbi:META domain-containing protein [Hymenobacter sp. AT01-02]|uniref:META domain-containing protein n=1 Tax=Hymenobacter sp. AT01-02 TaxID=1571877 RepID=UPI0005F1E0D1|nr:META domain-containing protein [Hymenobacter sp. AT01-02]